MQNHLTRAWTPEEDEILMDMVSEDIRFRDIAKKLGRTRNSCIGRMFRLQKKTEENRAKLLAEELAKQKASAAE